ncbi:hypothetical protein FZC35_01195 [Candidatus Cytomitobacter indipagum]|uniref:Uncharacterized protein n=1 Tax=Candidatus Cytomitobacter indipagum TaxID=2601575 RepID=A0A5C0UD86_9PROT|nr:hypothetical protein [Candidatus Cytomitobacter indipagum]QEK37995.1 hypothetical protein FZC35_01195 [Candidatus Cytomitobacter indipagum]
MLVYLLLAIACVNAEKSIDKSNQKTPKSQSNTSKKESNNSNSNEESPFHESDIYDYRGKAPFNIAGNVEILSTHLFSDQDQIVWSEGDKKNWSPKDKKSKIKDPFDNLKFSNAKIGIALQKITGNMKIGVQFAIKANPEKFSVSQASLYVKNYFRQTKLKLSARAGYTYGADKKLAPLSCGIISKTTNLYAMSDEILAPNVMTNERINTNTATSMKIMIKAKKFINNKENNVVAALSYTPNHPNKGGYSFAKINENDKLNDDSMKNHLGAGIKWNAKKGNFTNCSYATFGYAKRYEVDAVKMNDVKGFTLGNNIGYKFVKFGLSYGLIADKKIQSYSDDFHNNKIKGVKFDNQIHDKANGGYVVSPTVAFTIPSGSMEGLEIYASYMYSDRKTEWKDAKDSTIHAKSNIISTGFAMPLNKFTFGAKMEIMKFDNKAFKDEQLIKSYLTSKKEFNTLSENDKWRTVVSAFCRVKISHNPSVN